MNEAARAERFGTGSWGRPNLLRINAIGLATIVRKESRRVVRLVEDCPPAITMTPLFTSSAGSSAIGSDRWTACRTCVHRAGLIMMSAITNFPNVGRRSSRRRRCIRGDARRAPRTRRSFSVSVRRARRAGGGLVTVVALFFTDLHVAHPFITSTTVLLTAVVLDGGLLNAIFAKSFDDISIILTFVLTPLTYLGAYSSRSCCCRRSG
jgi:ABC-2 type transport system permease protein